MGKQNRGKERRRNRSALPRPSFGPLADKSLAVFWCGFLLLVPLLRLSFVTETNAVLSVRALYNGGCRVSCPVPLRCRRWFPAFLLPFLFLSRRAGPASVYGACNAVHVRSALRADDGGQACLALELAVDHG
jgi:hypothetical protein